MSNETKYDVFKDVVETLNVMDGAPIDDYCKDMINRYDEALPDDFPVIPKEIGEYIKKRKAAHDILAFALTARFIPNEVVEWMFMVAGDHDTELSQIEYAKQQETFARALVLGVWRVEKTGEIVNMNLNNRRVNNEDTNN